jgi:hypothetical protein
LVGRLVGQPPESNGDLPEQVDYGH